MTRRNAIPKAVFALSPQAFPEIFSAEAVARIRCHAALADTVIPGSMWKRHTRSLRDTEFLFSSWGAPVMDEAFLEKAPRLRAVFCASGSVDYFTTPALWRRGVRVMSARAINAIPVAEYTVSAVLFGLKHFWHYARLVREHRTFPIERPVTGAYRAKVGLVSYGTVARIVRERLRPYDLQVLVHDPALTAEEAAREGVQPVSLAGLFSECDVVSLHAPLLPESYESIDGALFKRMRPMSTFINTARGELVNEEEMIAVLAARPDLQAVLDVTSPEPPAKRSLLYDLPNVVLTPHIAGSLGGECLRMGDAMVDEFERFIAGHPLHWEILGTSPRQPA
ncbi:MAG: oxidoreductase [Rariglobus sp.]|nr:oxidoreductase [Rariglobus sp.]